MSDAFGLFWFVGVKFAGYWWAARILRKWYLADHVSPWKVAAVRTALGWVCTLVMIVLLALPSGESHPVSLFAGLRVIVWLTTLAIFYEKPAWNWGRALPRALVASLWSWLLDIPAILGWLPKLSHLRIC